MVLRQTILSILISAAIWHGYQMVLVQINLSQHGRTTEAEIVDREVTPAYTYLRLRYTVNGKTYLKGIRIPEKEAVGNLEKITIHYVPDRPDEPHLHLDREKVNNLVYYALVLAAIYGIYRFTLLMLSTTQSPSR